MSPDTGPRQEPRQVENERPPDPAEAAGKPLEPKVRDRPPEEWPSPEESPYSQLNNPVGEPDPTADSDPFDPNVEAGDPPPPGQFPGPGPEPEDSAA